MNSLTVEDNKFIYIKDGKQHVLLDCNDLLSNKSRIPMQTTANGLNIPNLLLTMLHVHGEVTGGHSENERALEYFLIDVLLVQQLIKSSKPIKVLEIGSTNGIMSYHLATILGKFHEESKLCCISDCIGNDSDNCWLDKISLISDLPKMSMLISDYDDTHLAPQEFDVVIINGSVRFEEPLQVIQEAKRLTKSDGILMAYHTGQPLLESSFQLSYSEREEYNVVAQSGVLLTRDVESIWRVQFYYFGI